VSAFPFARVAIARTLSENSGSMNVLKSTGDPALENPDIQRSDGRIQDKTIVVFHCPDTFNEFSNVPLEKLLCLE
jgi:hypothetical protein